MADQEINPREQCFQIDLDRAIARTLFDASGNLMPERAKRSRDHETSVTASAAAGGLPAKLLRV